MAASESEPGSAISNRSVRLALFVEEAYSYIFETAIAIHRGTEDQPDEKVSGPISKMLLGIINDWEIGGVSGLSVQAAYDFCMVYRELLTSMGMEIVDGRIAPIER